MTKLLTLHSPSSQAEIERRACLLFEEAGRPAGRDLDIWLQAETDYLQALSGLWPDSSQQEVRM